MPADGLRAEGMTAGTISPRMATASDQDFLAAKDARRKANASPEWQAVLQAFADWQATEAKAPTLLECMERSGMHCQVASGEE